MRPLFVLAVLLAPFQFQLYARAEFPTIRLDAVRPNVVQQGKRVQLTTQGAHLEALEHMLTASPVIHGTAIFKPRRLADFQDATGDFRVSVDQDCEPGLHWLRFQGRHGLSNARPLLVTRSPVQHIGTDISSRGLAQAIEPNTVYSHAFRTRQQACFSVSIGQEQTFSVVCYSTQLDSKAIPTLVLYDSGGQVVARSRALGRWPAAIRYAEAGDYFLIAHDFLYRGGDSFSYLLQGQLNPIDRADSLELNQLLHPRLEETREQILNRFAVTRALSQPASFTAESWLAHSIESLPAADSFLSDPTQKVWQTPFLLRGDLQQDLRVLFTGKKDQPLQFTVLSAGLDQLTDPYLTIFRVPQKPSPVDLKSATRVFEQDDALIMGDPGMRLRLRDPLFTWIPPEDGMYLAHLKDHQSGMRPDFSTQGILSVVPAEPGFVLLASPYYPHNDSSVTQPFGSNLGSGGTFAFRIQAVRTGGFLGPIRVRLVSPLPAGAKAADAVLPAGSSETAIVVTAGDSLEDWQGVVQFVGISDHHGQPIEAEALSASVSHGKTAIRTSPTSRRSKDLMLRLNPQQSAPIQVRFGKVDDKPDNKVYEVERNQTIKIPVHVTRNDAAKVNVILRARHLPKNISVGDVTLAADKDQGVIEMKVAGNATLGEFSFWLLCEAKLKWGANADWLRREEDYLAALKQADAGTNQFQKELNSQNERIKQMKTKKDITVWIPSNLARVRVTNVSDKSQP